MFKPLLSSAATWPIERLINRILQTDQHALSKLSRFSGKQIEVNTVSPQFNVCILFTDSEVRLSPFSGAELAAHSDAVVSSDAATLLGLLSAKTEDRPLANPRLKISGDAQLVQSVFNLAKSLDMRWDDLLNPIVGSTVSHGLKTSMDEFQQWSEASTRTFKHTLDDYLKEEAGVVPSAYSLEQFQDRLDQLRLRLDRATARTERLARVLGAP
jgi:ubiquinone biosynthesis protein UbiJ